MPELVGDGVGGPRVIGVVAACVGSSVALRIGRFAGNPDGTAVGTGCRGEDDLALLMWIIGLDRAEPIPGLLDEAEPCAGRNGDLVVGFEVVGELDLYRSVGEPPGVLAVGDVVQEPTVSSTWVSAFPVAAGSRLASYAVRGGSRWRVAFGL
jgi:hypothetical protein